MNVVAKAGDAKGQATVVERLGDRTLIYVRLLDGSFTGQDSGNSEVLPGGTVNLKFNTRQLHLFDATGKAYHAAES